MAEFVDTAEMARKIAGDLLRKGRLRPAVLVTVAGGHTEPFVDVDAVEAEVGDLCDVYVMPTGHPSWAFSEVIGKGTGVYGGASRVYSTDLGWAQNMYRSPLRFAWSPSDGARVAALLIEDVLVAVHESRAKAPPPTTTAPAAAGEVVGIIGGRPLVALDCAPGPWPATAPSDLVAPRVAPERVFTQGQRVTGTYDPVANRLDVSGSGLTPRLAFAGVETDSVLLAQVIRTGTKYATLTLLPGCEVRVPLDEFEVDESSGGFLVSEGEVLPVLVTAVSDGVPSAVQALPPNYADVSVPIAILPGGPRWLATEQVGVAPAPEETIRPADEPDAAFDPDSPDAPLLAESAALRRRMARLERDLEQARQQLRALKVEARSAKQETKRLRQDVAAAHSDRPASRQGLFADPGDQFLHEVYVTWAERTTAQDKAARPWRAPRLGPSFITTLDSIEGIDRRKVVEVVADIVGGTSETSPSRAWHQLRTGDGANDPVVTRKDGATCWRIYLQHNTPSARRLHLWRCVSGDIELSSVRLHDDNRP